MNFSEKGIDKRKFSAYLPAADLDALQRAADRQGRSLSWLIQTAWRLSRDRIEQLPDPRELVSSAIERVPPHLRGVSG